MNSVAGLRELLEKATPTPWSYHAGFPPWPEANVTGSVWSKESRAPIMHKPGTADALLVVAAVNSLPALLNVAEKANALVLELHGPAGGGNPTSQALVAALARLRERVG